MFGGSIGMLVFVEHREVPCSKLNFQIFQSHNSRHFYDVNIVSRLWQKNHFESYCIFIKPSYFDFKKMDFCQLKVASPCFNARYECHDNAFGFIG
jgi:hypothetical protein